MLVEQKNEKVYLYITLYNNKKKTLKREKSGHMT